MAPWIRAAPRRGARLLAVLALALLPMVLLVPRTSAWASSGPPPPKPSTTVPPLASVSGSNCYPSIIQWTQTHTVNNVQVNVTYLDPTVILSCVKNTYTGVSAQRAQAHAQLAGFPSKLRVELRVLAPAQGTLAPSKWRVTLSSAGKRVSSTSRSVTQAPTLTTLGTGTAYQETMIFVVPDPGKQFLPPKTENLLAEVTGPPGVTKVTWNFTGKAAKSTSSSANGSPTYIPILGWVVVAIGVILVGALWVTRPVSGQEA